MLRPDSLRESVRRSNKKANIRSGFRFYRVGHHVLFGVFEFEDAPAASEYMESGHFIGKIVIRL